MTRKDLPSANSDGQRQLELDDFDMALMRKKYTVNGTLLRPLVETIGAWSGGVGP